MNDHRDGFSEDAHRYLDGEPHRPLTEEERRRADRLKEISGEILKGALRPRGDVSERVMREVRRRDRPSRPVWVRPMEPHVFRWRPAVWIPSLAAAAMALFLGGVQFARRDTITVPAVAGEHRDTVYVRFELAAPEARSVHVAGSFNEWRADATPLRRSPDGRWTVTVPLLVGEHTYQFVVDGERWVADPLAEAVVEDGFGGRNSVVVVGPKGVVRS